MKVIAMFENSSRTGWGGVIVLSDRCQILSTEPAGSFLFAQGWSGLPLVEPSGTEACDCHVTEEVKASSKCLEAQGH